MIILGGCGVAVKGSIFEHLTLGVPSIIFGIRGGSPELLPPRSCALVSFLQLPLEWRFPRGGISSYTPEPNSMVCWSGAGAAVLEVLAAVFSCFGCCGVLCSAGWCWWCWLGVCSCFGGYCEPLLCWLVLSAPACSWCPVERLLVSRAVLCTSCAVHFSWDSLSSLSSVGSDQESGRECTAHAVHCLTLAISPWGRLLLSSAWFSFVWCCSTFLVLFQVPFNCTWFFVALVLGWCLALVSQWCRVMMNSVPASAVSLFCSIVLLLWFWASSWLLFVSGEECCCWAATVVLDVCHR